MKKILFIDLDGTIILEPPDEQIDSLEKLEFLPGAIVNLSKIAAELDFELVMVSNQDGLGTASFPEETFWPAHTKMLDILKGEGVVFSEILIDRSFPHENSPDRKPGIGMLKKYMEGEYDLEGSYVIGDRVTDIQLASNIGAKAIFIAGKENPGSAFTTDSWDSIYRFLRMPPRTAVIDRKTRETKVFVSLNLDGSGISRNSTGIPFFDHMLDQVAFQGLLDLEIKVDGDLEVDEHHTIEDTALALGWAFAKALSDKKGIERYGFLLPMDDALAQVAIDFSGRPWTVWEAEFKREMIGSMPTEMFFHFFKSFADAAQCNLNIKVEGQNEHHKIESIFKAFGKAIRMAVRREGGSNRIPSTKGIL